MMLCRPSANGRKPHCSPIESLIARQSSHASQDQRDVPPAVARKQMTQRSFSRDTSQPSHFCGASSSLQDCQTTGGPDPGLRLCSGPRRPPHGIWTESSVIRSRSAASAALRCSCMSIPVRRRRLGRPPLAHACVPALPLGHRAVIARLPRRRARYPNSRPLES